MFKPNYLPALVLLLLSLYGRAQDNLQNGLVACYAFSGNASDGSGNNNNGTVYGPVLTTDRFGNPNSAYQFDGINDYITLPESSLKNNNYTYSFWTRASSLPALLESYAVISIGGPGADQGVTLSHGYVGGSTGWAIVSYNANGSNIASNSVGSLPATNTWYHIVQTRSDAAVDLYVNGSLIGSRPTSGATAGYNPNSPGATIGSRSNLIQFFHGAIDDVRLYNRAVTSSEVTALYNANSVCQALPVPMPVAADVARCGPGTVTLTASGGSQYRWYNAASGGTLLHTGASFATPALTVTATYYVANVVNGRESARKEASAVINPIPPAPSVADAARCGDGTVTLSATGSQDYRWYSAQGALLGNGSRFTTPVLSKTGTFYVSGVDNDCEGPRKEVKVTVHPLPSTPLVTASGATAFCQGDSVVLSATPGCAGYQWSTGETTQSIVVKEAGSYWVKTTQYACNSCDRYTCESLPSKPVAIKVNALPEAPVVAQVCLDTLKAVSGGKVFAWYRDGVLLPFTSRAIPAEQTGSYTVKVRDINGCLSAASVPYAFTLEKECFTVYPNPSQGQFNVKVNGAYQEVKLEIITLREGKILWKTELPNADCRLNVTLNLTLPKGIYLIKLHARKGVYHQRLQIL